MPERTPGSDSRELIIANGETVDESIARMAHRPMSEVVTLVEGLHPKIGLPYGDRNATQLLVGRLFTDAVFNQDIRAIQLIINRIDGGLPRDVEVDDYQTLFGDCLSEVMQMTHQSQMVLKPDDTVMMALCKSLYSMAVQDIYWDEERRRPRNPSDAAKKERDAALRMVLERTGGRKTLSSVQVEKEDVEIAPWIAMLGESTC